MKVLCISLLRLGDILLHGLLVPSIKAKYPGAQISFMVFEEFLSASQVIEGVEDWHFLPRKHYEKILVQGQKSIVQAHGDLKKFIDRVNREDYDVVLNLTHTQLSYHITNLINSPEKWGAAQDRQRRSVEESWYHYFNDIYSSQVERRFHYVEVLAKVLNLPTPEMNESALKNSNKNILFQITSADTKKMIPMDVWQAVFTQLKTHHPELEIKLLSTESDRQIFQNRFGRDSVLVCSLPEAKKAIHEARMLVSLDTSLLHLANYTQTPTLGIFLGSARPDVTASYTKSSYVLTSSVPCHPCSHRSACTQKTQICAEEITSEVLLSAIDSILTESPRGPVLRVGRNSRSHTLLGQNRWSHVLAKSTWQFYLSDDFKQLVPPFGSYAFDLAETLQGSDSSVRLWLDQSITQITSLLESLRQWNRGFKSQATAAIETEELEPIQFKNHKMSLNEFRNHPLYQSDFFWRLEKAVQEAPRSSFTWVREVQSSYSEVYNLYEIQEKICRALKQELLERSHRHERRTGRENENPSK